MADNLSVTAGSGSTIGMDEVVDGTLGTVKVGFGKIMDGTLDSTNKLIVNSSGEALVKHTSAVPVTDNSGSLTVDDGGSSLTVDGTVAVTGVSTLAEQQTQTTSLQLIDDTILADNAGFTDGTTKVNVSGYIYDEVAGTALTENDAAAARINVNRSQVGVIEDGSTRGRYATVSASNALKVDGSAVTQPVSGTITANLAAGTNNIGDVDVLSVPAPLSTTGGGTEATALRVTVATDSTGVLSVDDNGGSLTVDGTVAVSGTVAVTDNSGSLTVDNAGTFAVQNTEVRPSSATVTSVASSATSVSILASNSSRRGATFFNDVDKICYLKFGTTASTSSFTIKIFANGFFSMPFPCYTGAIDAIWESSPTGSLRITEF